MALLLIHHMGKIALKKQREREREVSGWSKTLLGKMVNTRTLGSVHYLCPGGGGGGGVN